jgi:hypothetical protein
VDSSPGEKERRYMAEATNNQKEDPSNGWIKE